MYNFCEVIYSTCMAFNVSRYLVAVFLDYIMLRILHIFFLYVLFSSKNI